MRHSSSLGVEPSEQPVPTLPDALARNPGHLLWRAAARVELVLDRMLPAGTDIHAYAALIALDDGVPRTQQAVADRIGVSRTTMARVADELARAALVGRVRNPDDRRSYLLTGTAAGARAVESWHADAEQVESAMSETFDHAEVADLRRLLRAMIAESLDPGTPAPLLTSLGFLITRVHQRLHREFAERLAPWGVMPRDFGTLTLLGQGPVVQGELARMLGVSAATAVQIVDDLERGGLVERRRAEHDRRTQVVHLLPAGSKVQHAVKGHVDPRHGFHGLDRADTDRLIDLLARFVTRPIG